MSNFSPKRVNEHIILTVDYCTSEVIATGELITSATWSNSVRTGVDPAASAMVSGSATIDSTGTKVSQMIVGGVIGVSYFPICTAITNYGQILVLPDPGQGALFVVK